MDFFVVYSLLLKTSVEGGNPNFFQYGEPSPLKAVSVLIAAIGDCVGEIVYAVYSPLVPFLEFCQLISLGVLASTANQSIFLDVHAAITIQFCYMVSILNARWPLETSV